MSDNKVKAGLSDVPETLLLPLWGRAEMSRAGGAFLSDPTAAQIISRLDHDFTRIRASLNPSKNACWAARARHLDDILKGFISTHPAATIVNVGAGLDTTFQRVDNGSIRWFDLDLPEVINIRRRLIPEAERASCLACSMLETSWLDLIGDAGGGLMLVAGGVLFYFKEEELIPLFAAVGRKFPGAELVFDSMSQAGVRRANKMVNAAGMAGARLLWALPDAKALEAWDCGVQLVEQFPCFRGLPAAGLPFAVKVLMACNQLFRTMLIVHCRWSCE